MLARELYDAGLHRVDSVEKKPSEMPTQSAYVYFAGRNATSGRETVWVSTAASTERDGKRVNDEYVAAYALAALDAGYVGEPWKSLYIEAAKDDASRFAFGEQIARAFDDASDQQKNAAAADVAWLRQRVTVGMARKDIYAALRSYGLVAYNFNYAPGVSIGAEGKLFGCDRTDDIDQTAAAWPYPGEPLPKLTGACGALQKSFGLPQKPEPFPSAYLTLEGGFSIACSTEIHVEMTFGFGDLLKKLDISKPEWSCV